MIFSLIYLLNQANQPMSVRLHFYQAILIQFNQRRDFLLGSLLVAMVAQWGNLQAVLRKTIKIIITSSVCNDDSSFGLWRLDGCRSAVQIIFSHMQVGQL